MTLELEEAIIHAEEVAEKQEITAKSNLMEIDKIKADGILRVYDADAYESCMKCASDHRQLAEWLRELKKYRAIFEKVGKILADNGYTMDDLDTIFGKANDEEVNADE